jgi:hypothetical protein
MAFYRSGDSPYVSPTQNIFQSKRLCHYSTRISNDVSAYISSGGLNYSSVSLSLSSFLPINVYSVLCTAFCLSLLFVFVLRFVATFSTLLCRQRKTVRTKGSALRLLSVVKERVSECALL